MSVEKVTEYYVAEAGDADELARTVHARIREGWQPQGGVVFMRFVVNVRNNEESRWWYAQAMVKYDA